MKTFWNGHCWLFRSSLRQRIFEACKLVVRLFPTVKHWCCFLYRTRVIYPALPEYGSRCRGRIRANDEKANISIYVSAPQTVPAVPLINSLIFLSTGPQHFTTYIASENSRENVSTAETLSTRKDEYEVVLIYFCWVYIHIALPHRLW